MTDVRERVARAILETDPTCSYDACREKYERMHEGSVERNWWDHLHEQADAALSACGHREMREALEKMIQYADDFSDNLPVGVDPLQLADDTDKARSALKKANGET